MQTVALVSMKGGSGKTTATVHIAVAAAQQGRNVALIDTDPQQSAARWGHRRAAPLPVVLTAPPSRLAAELQRCADAGTDLAIIDTPPRAGSDNAAQAAAKLADLVLLPCRPSVLDVEAIADTAARVRAVTAAPGRVAHRMRATRPGCRPDSGGARRRCRLGRAGPPWSSHSVCSVATHGPGRAGTGPRRARRSGSRRRAYVHRAHTRTTRTLEHHQGGSLSTNSYATALQGRAPSRRPTAASRQGRRHVGAYVPPDVAQRLRVLAAQEDTSTQALIVEAIEMLFRSRRGGGGVG